MLFRCHATSRYAMLWLCGTLKRPTTLVLDLCVALIYFVPVHTARRCRTAASGNAGALIRATRRNAVTVLYLAIRHNAIARLLGLG